MQSYAECPQVLRDFLSYHESIKGQSRRTVEEYHLDLRMFLRFLTLMRRELPYNTPLDSIDIKWIDAAVLNTVTSSEIFDFLSYLTNDRQNREGPNDAGIAAASRARKLSAIKALYKYLTVSTKQISNNPVKDIEFPKIRRSLPKYLTLEESTALLKAVDGPNKNRDFANLMLFLNCGIRRSQLVGQNLTDFNEDRILFVWCLLTVCVSAVKATRNGSSTWARPAAGRSTAIWKNGTTSSSRTIRRCSAPGTKTASASPRSTGWSRSTCWNPDWTRRSFPRTSSATQRQR